MTWNPRLRTTAGRAWWPDRTVELNPRLRDLPEEEMWCTVRHELAHLIAYERAGRRRVQAHGPEWRLACAELGIPGESPCHHLPFEGHEQRRRYSYICPKCATTIERVRRMRGAVACYTCCRKHSGGRFDSRFRLVERRGSRLGRAASAVDRTPGTASLQRQAATPGSCAAGDRGDGTSRAANRWPPRSGRRGAGSSRGRGCGVRIQSSSGR